eukprot:UN06853
MQLVQLLAILYRNRYYTNCKPKDILRNKLPNKYCNSIDL